MAIRAGSCRCRRAMLLVRTDLCFTRKLLPRRVPRARPSSFLRLHFTAALARVDFDSEWWRRSGLHLDRGVLSNKQGATGKWALTGRSASMAEHGEEMRALVEEIAK